MKQDLRQAVIRYSVMTLGCAIMGIAINTFYIPHKLLSGGISGIAALLYYLCAVPMSLSNIIGNIPMFIIAYKYMNHEYTVSSLYGMLTFSASLQFFHFLSLSNPVDEPILACIAGGVLFGIGAACLYRVGGSSGGTDIIGAIIQKNYSISISTCNFIFNLALLLISVFFFGLEPVLHTLLAFFVMTKTCNAFTMGFDFKKNFIIISDKSEEIAEEIIKVVLSVRRRRFYSSLQEGFIRCRQAHAYGLD